MDSIYTFAESYALYDEPGMSIPPTIDPDLEWSSLNGVYDHAPNHDSFEDLFGFDVRTLDDLVSSNQQNIEPSTLQAFQEDETPTSGGEPSSVKDTLDVVDHRGLSLKEALQAFNEILEGAQEPTLNELVRDLPEQDVFESIYGVSTVSPAMTILVSSQTALDEQAPAPFAKYEWPTAQEKAPCPSSAPVAQHHFDSFDTPPSASPAPMNPNLTTSQSVQRPASPENTSRESSIYSSATSGSSSSTHVFADSSNTLAASKSNSPTDKHGHHNSADAECYTDLFGVQRRARRSGRGEKPHKQRRFKYKCGRWLTRSDALKRHIKNFHSENVEGRTRARARSNCNGGWSGKAQRLYPSIA
ncbi:hypothetical protein BDN70DRAFT_895384 [Pholiota conissans]|uniref:Uncharacterized protein n=1 Tax=Pholiota conissans TaxID=109636 RepID=A0A9P5Z3M0_9AGAR|nr:hypothetical protein BDN70DRAFT_895384 [Pholiota conissans]